MKKKWQKLPRMGLALVLFLSAICGHWDLANAQELPVFAADQALIPLARPLRHEQEDSWEPWKRYLALMQSAENLTQSCQQLGTLNFGTVQDQKTALRSTLATLQYLGLKVTIASSRAYAQKLGWSQLQRETLAHNLLSTCSPNMTLMGQKFLRDQLLAPISDSDQVGSFKISSNFPLVLREEADNPEFIRQEALINARLFRNLCSWGGDTEDLRLMPTLAHNPVVMSYVMSQMMGQEFSVDPKTHELLTRINPEATQVFCPDRLCRKVSTSDFMKLFPKSLGQVSFQRDLEGLYCHYLQDANIASSVSNQNRELERWSKQSTLEEERLLSSLFISHVTGVPDLVVRTKDLTELQSWIARGVLESFDRWALSALSGFSLFPEYEESMTLDVVAREVTGQAPTPLKLDMVLNWGEMDRTLTHVGKISLQAHLQLPARLAQWISHRSQEGPQALQKYAKEIDQRLKDQLSPQIKKWEKKLLTSLWQGDLVGKVAEVLNQEIARTDWSRWNFQQHQQLEIPVSLRFGPQSLKYLRTQFLKEHGQLELME